ncbi:hypothetical protein ASF79_15850 [Agreia sp. Leaf335]|uniref:ImmA/IrrE family metallo-endopeptidase n=1 Tax=Agreia sp. Leaf335 TaxID=1736340 RepID=UPI0006FA5127|nr:ImmA/IrrE family metallo-endopeptidase [Agreia sp. Leaf335]KQR19142.1 hypothetical protein ASF79_15850 [Agreia sp. Leaf335]
MANAAAHTTLGFAEYPPVDPATVAMRFGATVIVRPGRRGSPGSALQEHGRLSVRENRWVVEVPVETTAERRRFSIAHEIGHILLFDAAADNPDLVAQLRSPVLWKRVERLCNIGAAHLLMPTAVFTAAVMELLPPDRDNVEMLASRFWVSLPAAARRIAEVQNDWSVIFWEHSLKHPRGPAWRTASSQHQVGPAFLPKGLSSSRLRPDIVEDAAREGYSQAPIVLADLPGLERMNCARAWRVRSSRPELLSSDEGLSARQKERVFMFFKSAEQPEG